MTFWFNTTVSRNFQWNQSYISFLNLGGKWRSITMTISAAKIHAKLRLSRSVGVFWPPGVSTWSGVNEEESPESPKPTKLCQTWNSREILKRWIILRMMATLVWIFDFQGNYFISVCPFLLLWIKLWFLDKQTNLQTTTQCWWKFDCHSNPPVRCFQLWPAVW